MTPSTPWWSWERWERELDYAALLGVNVVNVGLQLQTAPIERAVFVEDFGLARADLPPEGLPCAGDYGGAAPAALEARNVELAQRILRRLRSLGTMPQFRCHLGCILLKLTAILHCC